MSRPTAGTWCADCWLRDHRCQAQLYVDGRALCLPCADGEPCSFQRVAAQTAADAPRKDEWGEPIPAPVRTLTPAELEAVKAREARAPEEKKKRDDAIEAAKAREAVLAKAVLPRVAAKPKAELPVAPTKLRLGRKLKVLGPVTEAQFRMDAPLMTLSALARKYEISWCLADRFCKTMGLQPSKEPASRVHRLPAGLKEKLATDSGRTVEIARKHNVSREAVTRARRTVKRKALGDRNVVLDDRAPAGIDALMRSGASENALSISLQLSEVAAVKIFTRLSPAHKQIALKAALEAALRG